MPRNAATRSEAEVEARMPRNSKFGVGSRAIPLNRGCLFVCVSNDERGVGMRGKRPTRRPGGGYVGRGYAKVTMDSHGEFGMTTQGNRTHGARGGCRYRDAKNDYPVLAGKIFSISLFIFCLLFFDFIFSINSWVLEL